MQWLYEVFYTAIGDLFADINNLGVEIFDLSWVQAVVNLFTMLGWSLFVVGVVVAVFEVAIESQSGWVNVKGTALNVLKGFFAASLVGVLPVQLYKTCCHLQGIFTADLAGIFAGEQSSTIGAFAGQILSLAFDPNAAVQVGLKLIFFLLAFAYCVIKVFFANIKRGGILLIQISVGSLYLFSVPRGYTDGFYQWCKQVIAICLTAFMQTTLLFLGMMTFQNNMLLGLGIMLAAGEVPRIAQQFGLDSSVRVNMSSVIYSTNSAVNLTRNLNGEMLQSRELGDQFQTTLKEMVRELQTNIPTIGVYIWSYAEDPETGNTQHTIISANVFDKLGNEKSICEWIYDAVNGNVQNYGLDLLK